MKNKLPLVAIALATLLSLGILSSSQAAPAVEGAKCLKLNAIVKSGKLSFKCVKSGKKLIYVTKFKKCADVISAGRAPIIRDSDPLLYATNSGLDRDKDGIACDK